MLFLLSLDTRADFYFFPLSYTADFSVGEWVTHRKKLKQ
jgi:hypothetical protein